MKHSKNNKIIKLQQKKDEFSKLKSLALELKNIQLKIVKDLENAESIKILKHNIN